MTQPWHAAVIRILRDRRLTFVDVGARGGVPPHWNAYAPVLDVAAFEPDSEEAERLRAAIVSSGAKASLHEVALWSERGSRTLTITKNPGCSSLFTPNRELLAGFPDVARFDTQSATELATSTLDTLLGSSLANASAFLKIDAQGGALPILTGAGSCLDRTIGIEVEVELAPIYNEEPLFGRVDEFLRERGFELVDLRPTYWRRDSARSIPGTRGQLVFGDALYMPTPEMFVRALKARPESAAHLCAGVLVACDVYRLWDRVVVYAAAAAGEDILPAARGILSGAGDDVSATIKDLPHFPRRYRLARWIKDLGDRLTESSEHWAYSEQRLGGRMRRSGAVSKLERQLRTVPPS
ncbi:MAG TPA: FkbM family methyltransferase [Gemmatimonadaceae bacterium]|nr:FkbM family methyltransferase [Gemmatimonadaceae bacterium]